MDRLIREANPPTGQLASPKPQYKKPGVDEYEPVEGQHGAPFAILKDASGNVVSPATDAKLEQVKSELELVKSELEVIKANQLSGDQKVQLSGTIVTRIIRLHDLSLFVGNTVNIVNHTSRGEFKSISINVRRYPTDREYEIRHLFGGVSDGSNDFTEIIPVEFQGNEFSIIIPVRDIRWGIDIRQVSGSDGLLNRLVIGGIR